MGIEISGIGLVTAQGCSADILNKSPISAPKPLFWDSKPWITCHVCFPAQGIDPMLRGSKRWQALAKVALNDCINIQSMKPGVPLIIASCNGGIHSFNTKNWQNAFNSEYLLEDTPYKSQHLPVVSASCVSGLHALYLATKLLKAGEKEIIVLAVDILSPANHDNYEALRILDGNPNLPWQTNNLGFIPGEAAVALLLTHSNPQSRNPQLSEPILTQDLNTTNGLNYALAALAPLKPDIIFGQGTGPNETDEIELKALQLNIDMKIPLTTTLVNFGHTNGATGLLSVALAALAWRFSSFIPTLNMRAKFAADGRPLGKDVTVTNCAAIICRALGGACAAVSLTRENQPCTSMNSYWQRPDNVGPLIHPLLRKIAAQAMEMRPKRPPEMLIVRLETPLVPLPKSRIGERLLPSSILEITPGFFPRLISRCWGFAGAAICLVGDSNTNTAIKQLIQTLQDSGQTIYYVDVQGKGEERYVKWAA
ncbi:MAG: hypothetical protein JSW07_13505 [bacterium]|nr:MAG: hypothetical protein JSW07_13505 [bacterium]